jgi:glycosyltransferase involved in cell wall biosynthesis
MGHIMNIGQVVSFGVGGADKAALNLIKGLLFFKDKINITVFYNKYSHPRNDELITNPSRFDDYLKLDVKLVEFENVNELNQYDIDILHTHRSGNDNWFLPNFEQTNFKFKVIETNFHGYNKTKSDLRVYPSFGLTKKLESCDIPYEIIPNPIISPLTKENLKLSLNLEGKFIYGRIARPDSNIYSDLNLRAYKQIESEDTYFIYVAPNIRAIEDSKKLGIKNIIFIDASSDEIYVSKLYNTFDVLCHSNSLGETFGNTIAEAMIHGKPVISHIGNTVWCQAHEELFGDLSELFLKDDILNQYSKKMLQLKNDKNFYNSCSLYFKNKADQDYDYIKVAEKYINIYNNLK